MKLFKKIILLGIIMNVIIFGIGFFVYYGAVYGFPTFSNCYTEHKLMFIEQYLKESHDCSIGNECLFIDFLPNRYFGQECSFTYEQYFIRTNKSYYQDKIKTYFFAGETDLLNLSKGDLVNIQWCKTDYSYRIRGVTKI